MGIYDDYEDDDDDDDDDQGCGWRRHPEMTETQSLSMRLAPRNKLLNEASVRSTVHNDRDEHYVFFLVHHRL